MHLRLAFTIIPILALAGCAVQPSAPPEPALAVKLKGTAVEVQNFIEQHFRLHPELGYQIQSETDRAIVLQSDCNHVPDMNAFKCSLIMLGIANSEGKGPATSWDGPFSVATFRTAEIRGEVNVTANFQWCASDSIGKTYCMPNGSVADSNNVLRKLTASYRKEVQP